MTNEKPILRVVVDTNVFIRSLISTTGSSALLVEAIREHHCILITSRTHLSEIHRVLCRRRFVHRYGITRHQRQRLISRLYSLAIYVKPSGRLTMCRDPKDDYLIEMALLGRATHLVSEDKDLHDDPDIVELLRLSGIQLVGAWGFMRALASTS